MACHNYCPGMSGNTLNWSWTELIITKSCQKLPKVFEKYLKFYTCTESYLILPKIIESYQEIPKLKHPFIKIDKSGILHSHVYRAKETSEPKKI